MTLVQDFCVSCTRRFVQRVQGAKLHARTPPTQGGVRHVHDSFYPVHLLELLLYSLSKNTQSFISSSPCSFFLVVTNPILTSSFQDLLKAISCRLPSLCRSQNSW